MSDKQSSLQKIQHAGGLYRRLLRSHLFVAGIGLVMLAVSIGILYSMRAATLYAAQVRSPSARTSAVALQGVQKSLAALRGWVALGDEEFKAERAAAWNQEIDPAIAELERLSTHWHDQADLALLEQAQERLRDLKKTQWWIEDLAQTPGNEPARTIVRFELEPIAEHITGTLNLLIHLTANSSAPRNRTQMLLDLVDLRLSFSRCQLLLSHIIDQQQDVDMPTYHALVATAKQQFDNTVGRSETKIPEEKALIANLNDGFRAYHRLASEAVQLSQSAEANVALSMLSGDAVPAARDVTMLLGELSNNQAALMRRDAQALAAKGSRWLGFSIVFGIGMLGITYVVSRRNAAAIARPIATLASATEQLATGNLAEDLPITSCDEVGHLTESFNTMRTQLEERTTELAEQTRLALLAEQAANDAEQRRDAASRKSQAMSTVIQQSHVERERLAASEQLFRATLEAAPTAILMINREGQIVLANSESVKLFGYSQDELLSHPMEMLLPPRLKSRHEKHRAGYIANPTTRRMSESDELVGMRKDGTEFLVEVSLSPVTTDDEMFVICSIDDITVRKRAEIALRDRDELITSLLNSTAEGIYGLDLEGNCTFANPTCAKMLGYKTPDEFLGKNMHQLIHHTRSDGTSYPVNECPIFSAFREGRGVHVEDESLWKQDGTPFPAEFWSYPVIRNGELVGSVVTFLDITERRKSENEVRRLADIVESSDDAIFGATLEGLITSWNDGAERLYGYSASEMVGQPSQQLFAPEQSDAVSRALEQIGDKQSVRNLETVQVCKDGAIIDVSLTISLLMDQQRNVVGTSTIARDITQRKLLEKTQQQINIELEQRVEQRTRELNHQHQAAISMAEEAQKARLVAEQAERRLEEVASQLAMPPRAPHDRTQTFSVSDFSLSDMMTCGAWIRGLSQHHASQSEYAKALVRIFHQHFQSDDGESEFALVRVFHSKRFKNLTPELQTMARSRSSDVEDDTICLSLLATVGDQPEWCEVENSKSHRTIPLNNAETVRRLPMMSRLFKQLGISFNGLGQIQSNDEVLVADTGVFHIQQAQGSEFVPAQEQFVEPFGIQSVVGFGDILPNGNLFVVIGFVKHEISAKVALLFSHLSHSTRLGWLPYIDSDQKTVWQMLAFDQLLSNHERIVADQEAVVLETMAAVTSANEALARSNQELEQFAYVASHDLQEPLRKVASCCQALAEDYSDNLDEDGHEWIQFAVDGATRMRRLVSDLMEFSRVSTKGKPPVPADAFQCCEEALQNLADAIEEKHAQVICRPLPTVLADKQQLTQLFQNLIGNGLKYCSDDQPVIEIGAEPEGGHWRFYVKDNGIGIAPEFHERIFQVFQRLHRKEDYPGTGIGLAICKKIVERLGGRLSLESQTGQGSTFYFTIPSADLMQNGASVDETPRYAIGAPNSDSLN